MICHLLICRRDFVIIKTHIKKTVKMKFKVAPCLLHLIVLIVLSLLFDYCFQVIACDTVLYLLFNIINTFLIISLHFSCIGLQATVRGLRWDVAYIW